MDLKLSEDVELFKSEVREWLKSALPDWWNDIEQRTADQARYEEFVDSWDYKLYEAGYSGLTWPVEYGGQGRSAIKEIMLEEELGRADAPKGHSFLGKILLAPTLMKYGTEEQKRRFLPRLISSEDIWCQGFSEPNAGSDLAALETKAVLDGDEWVINGQKVWTTSASKANWCFLLARTDSEQPKHKGITYLLVPMDAEGVSIRPLQKISGEAEFNEIFFQDVRIPKENHIGEINAGWKIAMTTLSYERGILALGRQARFETELSRAIEHYISAQDEPVMDQRVAELFVELQIMRYHGLKTISNYVNNDGKIGPEASLQKLYWSELRSKLGKFYMDMQDNEVFTNQHTSFTNDYFTNIYYTTLGETIYAGTSQIQRNIIAEKLLGLPK